MHEHNPAVTSSLEEIEAPRSDNETSRVQIAQLSPVLESNTPQPAHRRPTTDGHPSSLCEPYGGMVPRSGATTVYGTPFVTPTASGRNSETSSIFPVSGKTYDSAGVARLNSDLKIRILKAKKGPKRPSVPSVSSRDSTLEMMIFSCPNGSDE